MHALRLIWASPASLLGLLLAPFFHRRRIVKGVLLCEGASWPRRLGWKFSAITLGHVVLSVDDIGDEMMRHELVHVRQYERWGPLMLPAYLGASVAAAARGRHYYRDNRFEIAARSDATLDPRDRGTD